mmetsp:Transcript_33154/g.76417  ORF Transcript_33154/g.76417 Transcript_33154/m.76417 type:complete len:182 (-) Transcript_33154:802-1347(-)
MGRLRFRLSQRCVTRNVDEIGLCFIPTTTHAQRPIDHRGDETCQTHPQRIKDWFGRGSDCLETETETQTATRVAQCLGPLVLRVACLCPCRDETKHPSSVLGHSKPRMDPTTFRSVARVQSKCYTSWFGLWLKRSGCDVGDIPWTAHKEFAVLESVFPKGCHSADRDENKRKQGLLLNVLE